MSRSIRLAGWLSALALVLGGARLARAESTPTKTDDAAKEEPPPGLRLTVTPSLDGPWKMVIANQGKTPMRVLADGRLLTLEIVGAPTPPEPETDDKAKKRKKPAPKPKAYPRGKIPTCRMPAEMRPPAGSSERALVLEPGDWYEESFDPVAYCGASEIAGELGVGAVVYGSLGFPDPHPRAAKKKRKKGDGPVIPDPPYLAESLKDPADATPVRLLEAEAAIVMAPPPDIEAPTSDAATQSATKNDAKTDSARPDPTRADAPKSDTSETKSSPVPAVKADATKPDATKPDAGKTAKLEKEDAPVDERAPRVEVTSHPRADAGSAEDVAITVTTKNVGKRTAMLHLRTDDLAFRVLTPTGRLIDCNKEAEGRAAVRDFFETLHEGHHKTMVARLREVCPTGTFLRPGVYTVTPRLVLHDSGVEYRLTALVATAEAKRATKIRVRRGPLPYHPVKPVVATKPVPKPEPEPVDDEIPAP